MPDFNSSISILTSALCCSLYSILNLTLALVPYLCGGISLTIDRQTLKMETDKDKFSGQPGCMYANDAIAVFLFFIYLIFKEFKLLICKHQNMKDVNPILDQSIDQVIIKINHPFWWIKVFTSSTPKIH